MSLREFFKPKRVEKTVGARKIGDTIQVAGPEHELINYQRMLNNELGWLQNGGEEEKEIYEEFRRQEPGVNLPEGKNIYEVKWELLEEIKSRHRSIEKAA